MINLFDKIIHHDPYDLEIAGEKIVVNNGVFTPDQNITNSSSIILNNLPDIKDKVILDMGTGTGIIAIVCSRKEANKVVAVDVDDDALVNTKKNLDKTGVKNIDLIKSNLYENVSGAFDYIFANLPIDDSAWNLGDKTLSIVDRFLTKSIKHLNKGGVIYLPWFSISDVNPIHNIVDRLGFNKDVLIEDRLGFTWYLFKLSLK